MRHRGTLGNTAVTGPAGSGRAVFRVVWRDARDWIRHGLQFVATIVFAVVAVTAFGAAVGRWRLLAAPPAQAGVHLPSSPLLLTTPVNVMSLHAGDLVVARTDASARVGTFRIAAVDSWTHIAYTRGPKGHIVALRLGAHPQRVSLTAPWVGAPFHLITNELAAILLLMLAAGLFAWMLARRRAASTRAALIARLRLEVAATVAGRRLERRRFFGTRKQWTRVGVASVWALGVLSLTASATFQGTAETSSSAPSTTAVASISLPAITGANTINGTLTTAFTTIAPGDLMERPVDVKVNSTTTASLLTNMSMAVSVGSASSPNGAGLSSANGLQFWVQMCSGTGWTEAGSTPGYTYTCSNSLTNQIGGTAQTSAGTCPGAGSPVALSSLSSANNFSNMPNPLVANTTYHLLVTACFPTAADDTYQDASGTLTFTFVGVQRAGTNK